jgi:hypothetical protein
MEMQLSPKLMVKKIGYDVPCQGDMEDKLFGDASD